MLNLTPHPITIRGVCSDITIPPSGTVARVVTHEVHDGWLAEGPDGLPTPDRPGWGANGDLFVPVIRRTFSQVEGLPEEGTPCIVSSLVAQAVPGRRGVYAPDTGSTAVRDKDGCIVAVTRLVAA